MSISAVRVATLLTFPFAADADTSRYHTTMTGFVKTFLTKIKHEDPDYRYMAASDLLGEFKNDPSIKFDSSVQAKVRVSTPFLFLMHTEDQGESISHRHSFVILLSFF